jgi:hypothetical protein
MRSEKLRPRPRHNGGHDFWGVACLFRKKIKICSPGETGCSLCFSAGGGHCIFRMNGGIRVSHNYHSGFLSMEGVKEGINTSPLVGPKTQGGTD